MLGGAVGIPVGECAQAALGALAWWRTCLSYWLLGFLASILRAYLLARADLHPHNLHDPCKPLPNLLPAETKKMDERIEWVDKRSSRIWRGRMESRYWRYIKGSGAAVHYSVVGRSTAGWMGRPAGCGVAVEEALCVVPAEGESWQTDAVQACRLLLVSTSSMHCIAAGQACGDAARAC